MPQHTTDYDMHLTTLTEQHTSDAGHATSSRDYGGPRQSLSTACPSNEHPQLRSDEQNAGGSHSPPPGSDVCAQDSTGSSASALHSKLTPTRIASIIVKYLMWAIGTFIAAFVGWKTVGYGKWQISYEFREGCESDFEHNRTLTDDCKHALEQPTQSPPMMRRWCTLSSVIALSGGCHNIGSSETDHDQGSQHSYLPQMTLVIFVCGYLTSILLPPWKVRQFLSSLVRRLPSYEVCQIDCGIALACLHKRCKQWLPSRASFARYFRKAYDTMPDLRLLGNHGTSGGGSSSFDMEGPGHPMDLWQHNEHPDLHSLAHLESADRGCQAVHRSDPKAPSSSISTALSAQSSMQSYRREKNASSESAHEAHTVRSRKPRPRDEATNARRYPAHRAANIPQQQQVLLEHLARQYPALYAKRKTENSKSYQSRIDFFASHILRRRDS